MNTPETVVHKRTRGWEAITYYPMGEARDHFDRPAERKLRITTGKRSNGGLSTWASCVLVRDGMMSFAIGGDFSKTVQTDGARCTEKSVRTLHERALAQAEQILAEAKAFYEAKERPRRAALCSAIAEAQEEGQTVL